VPVLQVRAVGCWELGKSPGGDLDRPAPRASEPVNALGPSSKEEQSVHTPQTTSTHSFPRPRSPRVGGGCASRQGTWPARWQDRSMLQLLGFIIDCPDPMRLAAFYSEVTGRDLMEGSSDNAAGIPFGEVGLTFQRVEDYRPPRWPDDEHPKHYHLDFEVDLIKPEQRRVVELGATLQKDFIGPEGYG